MSIKLRDKVRDTISGFEGTVTSRTEFLNGCIRLGVTPASLHEGKPIEPQWFDEAQLELVETSLPTPEPATRRGGPRPDAQRAQDCPGR